MDADEHRLIVDFYLCKFVFICGCLHRFRSEAERLREILIHSEDVCACEPASLYRDSSVLLRVLCGDKCLKARWSTRLIQIL